MGGVSALIPISATLWTFYSGSLNTSVAPEPTSPRAEQAIQEYVPFQTERSYSMGQNIPLWLAWVSLLLIGGYSENYKATIWFLYGFCMCVCMCTCSGITMSMHRQFTMWKMEVGDAGLPWHCPVSAAAKDTYQLNSPRCLRRSVCVAVAQIVLFYYYIVFLWSKGAIDLNDSLIMEYYITGVVVQAALMYKVGGAFVGDLAGDIRFWAFQVTAASCEDSQLEYSVRADKVWHPQMYVVVTRFIASQLVNVFGACFILMSLPLLLANSENRLEFVLNAAATVFIVELDDLNEEMEIVWTNPPRTSQDSPSPSTTAAAEHAEPGFNSLKRVSHEADMVEPGVAGPPSTPIAADRSSKLPEIEIADRSEALILDNTAHSPKVESKVD